jgi:hypothetical protein
MPMNSSQREEMMGHSRQHNGKSKWAILLRRAAGPFVCAHVLDKKQKILFYGIIDN